MLGAVTATPRAVVEEFYRRLNAGERDAPARFEPEIEWHWPPDTPGAGVFHGYEGIDRGFNRLDRVVGYRLRGAGSGSATRRRRAGASWRATGRPRGVQTPARVNVTCVTPLGEEVASTS